MLAQVKSFGISGLEAYPVTIQVDVSRGMPSTIIVGLPDSAVRESKERVRTAIKNSGYQYGPKRTTINLSPADIKKEGPSFDLAIAIGILAATEQINSAHLEKFIFLGELSLDGKLHAVSGVLSAAMSLASNKQWSLVIPSPNTPEAALATRDNIYPVDSLHQAISLLNNPNLFHPLKPNLNELQNKMNKYTMDFSEVKGQAHVKRGLEIAAAGNHNVLLIGPPGSGKSMLAKRLPTILPDMTLDEILESTKIHSALGYLKPKERLITTRPFRSPHHTTSDVAVVGGGSIPKPGEVTLSHNGILFLDEFPEFSRNVLESLRQPLEDHYVTIARASKTIRFPSQFMLITAMNPCPCGFLTDTKRKCSCSTTQVQRYLSKISGPLLDRIDIHLEVPALSSFDLLEHRETESSHEIKKRTVQARAIQQGRLEDCTITANAYMNHRQIKSFCHLSDECKQFLKKVIEELGISARAYDKILKVARTIADLAGEENVAVEHIAEAIQYRYLDRNWGG